MKKSKTLSTAPTRSETLNGACYLAFQFLLLPGLLTFANSQLEAPLSSAELNFTYYLINFMAMLLIFHDFLGRSARQALQHPAYLCQAVILGLAAYYACTYALNQVISLLLPSYSNYNDEAIAAMSRSSFFLMTVGTVILVPPFGGMLLPGTDLPQSLRKKPLVRLSGVHAGLCHHPYFRLHR